MTSPFIGRTARASLIAFALSGALASQAAAAPATVTVANDAFSPADASINVGESVTWNFSEGGHNVNGDGGIKGNDTFEKGTYSKTFDTAGTFKYVCDAHPGMKGTVSVAAAAATTAAPAPGQSGAAADPNAASAAAAGTAAWSFPTAEDRLAPAMSRLSAKIGRKAARPTLSLNLTEDATVVVGVRRVLAVARASAAAPALRLKGKRGANRFSLKVRGLRAGRYKLRVIAIDAAGNESPVRTATLRVAR